jgi:two-component system, NtrC family, C4-dicarboxylate transport response regulator DctD
MAVENTKRILIVDDDRDVRNILGSVLRQRGLDVSLASNGREALHALREHHFAVMILDLLMPEADGFEVLDELYRSDPKTLPVVLVLTGADKPVVDRLDPDRIHGIVRKPFDPDDLASVVLACAEIRSKKPFEAMALATMLATSPLIAFLSR